MWRSRACAWRPGCTTHHGRRVALHEMVEASNLAPECGGGERDRHRRAFVRDVGERPGSSEDDDAKWPGQDAPASAAAAALVAATPRLAALVPAPPPAPARPASVGLRPHALRPPQHGALRAGEASQERDGHLRHLCTGEPAPRAVWEEPERLAFVRDEDVEWRRRSSVPGLTAVDDLPPIRGSGRLAGQRKACWSG